MRPSLHMLLSLRVLPLPLESLLCGCVCVLGLCCLDSVPLEQVLLLELEGGLLGVVDLGVSIGHALSVNGRDGVDDDAVPLGLHLLGDLLCDSVPAGGGLACVVEFEVHFYPLLEGVLFLLGDFHLHSFSSIFAMSSMAWILMS